MNVVDAARKGSQFNIMAGCRTIAGAKYKKQHSIKVLALRWAICNILLPKGIKCYFENWEKERVIESNGKELYWTGKIK